MLRFLGTSPHTLNFMSVVLSTVNQLSRLFTFNLPKYIPANSSELKAYFEFVVQQLFNNYPEFKFIFLFDSIDQLERGDYSLDWLLSVFPANVKMVYSVLTDFEDIYKRYGEKMGNQTKNVAFVDKIDKETAKLITFDWLKKADRQLTNNQWETLDLLYSSADLLPLYLKLIYDIVSKWTSYYLPDDSFKSCRNIDSCIEYLFKSLEKDYGKLLFSHALFYMSSFQNGISENDLEE